MSEVVVFGETSGRVEALHRAINRASPNSVSACSEDRGLPSPTSAKKTTTALVRSFDASILNEKDAKD